MFPVSNITSLDHHLFKEKNNRDLVKGIKMLYEWKGDLRPFEGFVTSRNVTLIIASLAKDEELIRSITEQKEEEINMCESMRLYREKTLMEGEAIGLSKGEKIGLSKGEKIGLSKGERHMLIDLLKLKLGYLSKEVIVEINKSSDEQLDKIKINVLTINSEEEILDILGLTL